MLPEKRRLGRLKAGEQVEIVVPFMELPAKKRFFGMYLASSRQITRLQCLSEIVNEFQVLIIYKLPFIFYLKNENSRGWWSKGIAFFMEDGKHDFIFVFKIIIC